MNGERVSTRKRLMEKKVKAHIPGTVAKMRGGISGVHPLSISNLLKLKGWSVRREGWENGEPLNLNSFWEHLTEESPAGYVRLFSERIHKANTEMLPSVSLAKTTLRLQNIMIYTSARCDRNVKQGGGCATFIKADLAFRKLCTDKY